MEKVAKLTFSKNLRRQIPIFVKSNAERTTSGDILGASKRLLQNPLPMTLQKSAFEIFTQETQ
jgi:hypothetical protein